MINNILYKTETKYSAIYWKTEYTSEYCPLQDRKKMALIYKTNNTIKQLRIPFSK
jgi:hypothetical protein